MTHLPSSISLIIMSVVLALSTVVVGHLQVSRQPSILDTLYIRDTNGPVTVNIYSPPLPALRQPEQSNARLEGLMIFNVVVATLLIYQSIRAISHWPLKYTTSLVQTKAGPLAGRRSAVPDWPDFRLASPTRSSLFCRHPHLSANNSRLEVYARSLDKTVALRTARPLSEPLLLTGPLRLESEQIICV